MMGFGRSPNVIVPETDEYEDDLMELDPWTGRVIGRAPRHPGFTYKGGLYFADRMTCGNYSTPDESPYAYGVHVVNGPVQEFRGDNIQCDYSDRLAQWHNERWKEACKLLSGPGIKAFSYTSLDKISKFLSKVYGYKVQALQVLEGCNVGNGYPYVIFVSKRVHPPRKKKDA